MISRASTFRYGRPVSQLRSIARCALDPVRFRLAAPCADTKSRIQFELEVVAICLWSCVCLHWAGEHGRRLFKAFSHRFRTSKSVSTWSKVAAAARPTSLLETSASPAPVKREKDNG
jgi:hypothetical protein